MGAVVVDDQRRVAVERLHVYRIAITRLAAAEPGKPARPTLL
jgi:hypothetical protein